MLVNASSEEHRLAVNGMSYHDRAGENANSAVIVTVTPDDFGSDHPLAGISFQRSLEEKAYQAGQGKIPVQRFGDFKEDQITTSYGMVHSCMKGASVFGDVRGIFPEERDLTSRDPECANTAIQYIKDSVDFAVKVGAPYIIVVPSPVGRVALLEGYTYDEVWEK